MRHVADLTIVGLASLVVLTPARSFPEQGRTWEVRSSLTVEAICFVNTLAGTPYYVRRFQEDYNYYYARFTPEVRAALTRLREWKEKDQIILSSRLLTIIPDVTGGTLDDLVRAIDLPGERFKMTPEEYGRIAPDLRTVFTFLRDSGFAEYWEKHHRPHVQRTVDEFRTMSAILQVIPAIEGILGHPLAAQAEGMISLVAAYVWPNSIALSRYTIIPPDMDSDEFIRTSIHELLHAFDAPPGSQLERALRGLAHDPFVKRRFDERNPAWGYNEFDGYLEESVARALDQHLTERFDVAVNPRIRWLRECDGMFVFAAALDYVMKREGFPAKGESFETFYLRMVNEGKIGPGKIEELYNAYYPWKLWLLEAALALTAISLLVWRISRSRRP
jgi:hypothetical protein